jgi:transposase
VHGVQSAPGLGVISLGSDLRILIASKPVDFRKGINGLAALVSPALGANPYSGDIYVFRSKRNDRLKMIVWNGSGMVLLTKVLEDRRLPGRRFTMEWFVLAPANWRFCSMAWTGQEWRKSSIVANICRGILTFWSA